LRARKQVGERREGKIEGEVKGGKRTRAKEEVDGWKGFRTWRILHVACDCRDVCDLYNCCRHQQYCRLAHLETSLTSEHCSICSDYPDVVILTIGLDMVSRLSSPVTSPLTRITATRHSRRGHSCTYTGWSGKTRWRR